MPICSCMRGLLSVCVYACEIIISPQSLSHRLVVCVRECVHL